MNSDWSVSNYKIVILLKSFPMVGCKIIWKQTWDDYGYKKN
jgi:hypothetical protein